MENASKALIMAGGILIAVMLVSVSMYIITSARDVARVSNERLEANAIQSFNRFYTSYGASPNTIYYISGDDALNIYRKVYDDNNREARNHVIEYDVSSNIINLSNNIDEGVVDWTVASLASVLSGTYGYQYSIGADGYISKININ